MKDKTSDQFNERILSLEKEMAKLSQELNAKNRALEIENALELVRVRAMAMKESHELKEVIQVVYDQVVGLGIKTEHAGFILNYKENEEMHIWLADKKAIANEILIPYFDSPHWNSFLEAKEKGRNFFANHLSHEEKNKFYRDLFKQVADLPEDHLAIYLAYPALAISTVLLDNIGLYIENFEGLDYTDEENKILMRFGRVFQQSYTRFLDLQKAEAQAREAQIEAALDRVRARSMGMHSSEELVEVATVLHNELRSLNVREFAETSIVVHDEPNQELIVWGAQTGSGSLEKAVFPLLGDQILQKLYDKWRKKEDFFTLKVEGAALRKHIDFVFPKASRTALENEAIKSMPDPTFFHCAFFCMGYLELMSDKELSQGSSSLLVRFARVFDQTYTRFLDLQKAEAQAREAQIEAALEKVRSKSLAMHKSEELGDLSLELVKQVHALGVDTWFCAFNIYDEDSDGSLEWGSNGENVFPQYSTPREGIFLRYYEAGQKGEYLLINEIGENECAAHYKYLCTLPGVGDQLLKMKAAGIPFPTSQIDHVAFFKYGYIIFITYEETQKSHDVFMRFAKVFEQSFARFLDLKKAEAQARESQIELALERVRSRSMAMHKSTELSDIVALMFKEMEAFGFATSGCELILADEKNDQLQFWLASLAQNMFLECFNIPRFMHPLFQKQWKAWKDQIPRLTITLEGQEKTDFNQLLFEKTDYKRLPEEVKEFILNSGDVDVFSLVVFKQGLLEVVDTTPLSDEMFIIMDRFANVFEQAYTRFLDLKKAEAQVREAQIAAALERVRSKTMAMHNSEDVSNTVVTLFDEVLKLGLDKSIRCGIGILKDRELMETWSVTNAQNGVVDLKVGLLDMSIHPLLREIKNAWKNEKKGVTYTLSGKEVQEYYGTLNDAPEYPFHTDLTKLPKETHHNSFCFPSGVLFSFTDDPISEEATVVLNRFAGVFGQTYTRFLDLQKAEAQAREALIEAALERVRSKAMAMRSSEDIGEATTILFNEIEKLGLETMRCGILIIHDNKIMDVWTTSATNNDKIVSISGQINMTIHPLLEGIFNSWKSGASQSQYELVGKGGEKYYEAIGQELNYNLPTSSAIKDRHFNTSFNFNEGALFTFTKSKISESVGKIYKRFAKVFGLTYQRYRELIESEKREKEANKQSSLDRVRGEIASMRSTKDLNRITPIIWQELINLGVPFFRCGVFIMNEENENIQVYLSDPHGKSLGLMNLDFKTSDLTKKSANAWRNKEVFKTHWNKDEFRNWTNSLKDLGKIETKEGYQGGEDAPDSLDLHFVPFKQGMLYVGNLEPLTEDQIELVRNLSESFSIAYSRYEDFSKLEKAKANLEQTLDDLKSTQSQLIQSEKMASLGELTAGIAHEIQNPLNFVNNFSEVSSELMDEMNEEIEKGDLEEAKFIAQDIKQNLEKINLHGQRASSIVKGMLDHSRTSSGEKVLTDVNQLTDEYLRLSYHGLRAKDRSFNAKYETSFDESLPKLRIVPQDMGRVILNLINNGFYAVNEKKKTSSGEDYEPTVTIATFAEEGNIKIIVKDNGNGIPKHVIDKVFQPFFTTKPTGQGTGLGLSLSYDIVKAHGGELSVESQEGEGTEFTVCIPIA